MLTLVSAAVSSSSKLGAQSLHVSLTLSLSPVLVSHELRLESLHVGGVRSLEILHSQVMLSLLLGTVSSSSAKLCA